MRILDRYVLRHFLLAYVVCFTSLLSLYMVIDLFSRIDEFAEHSHGARQLFYNFGTYYLFRVPWFFQRLSGVICLMAAMFAVAWLERQNEVTPWLAAGIPGRRLVYPILAATVGIIGLSIANRELLIPRCSAHLQKSAGDDDDSPTREDRVPKTILVQPTYDSNGILLAGRGADPKRKTVTLAELTIPAELAGQLVHLESQEMFYRPARGLETSGWALNGVKPERVECAHPALNWLEPGRYFLHTDASFQRLTRKPDWFYYESTRELLHLAKEESYCQRRGEVVAMLHRRLTTPLLDLILVLLGLPVMFGRFERNVYLKIGACMIVYAVFQSSQFVCSNLAQHEWMDPILAAWLPVFVFGPLALLLGDAMKS